MKIKIPKKLKIFLYKKENKTLIKMVNCNGTIKKIFNTKFIKIFKKNNFLELIDLNFKKENNLLITYKYVIQSLMFNLFKFCKERLVLEGVGYKV
jgi:hypothetical protein